MAQLGAIWADGIWNTAVWDTAIWSQTPVVNSSPTDIQISRSFVRVDDGLNAAVGTLTAVDADSSSHTFTLVVGTCDTSNADFAIAGNVLTCDDPATLGVGTYSVRIEADDGESTPYAKALVILVADVPDGTTKKGIAHSAITKPVHSAIGVTK